MPYIQVPDRQQLTFLNKLDDLVAPEHPVRLLDALVERIIGQDPAFFDHLAPEDSVGRGGYPGGCLIKLLLYGYYEGISSSRKLQTEARRNIEVIWLLNSLRPGYKTIANYRKDHGPQIQRVQEQIMRFLADQHWIDGQRVAIDGTRIKAYTRWEMPTEEELQARLDRAHAELEQYLDQLAGNDAYEEGQAEQEGRPEAGGAELLNQIGRRYHQIEELEAARDRLARSGAGRIPLSDPQARVMRRSHGGKLPGYNLQIGVDKAHHFIVAMNLTNHANDASHLMGMHQGIAGSLGNWPQELLADAGYADLGDIKQIQQQTPTRCYIPEQETRKKRNQPIRFSYEPGADRYRCTAGRVLVPRAKGRYNGTKGTYYDIYRGRQCGGCPMQSLCTQATDGVRQIKVYHGARWRHDYARQIQTRYAQARIAERKGVVEHVFGTLRYWMGQIPIKLRGLKKVSTEMRLYVSGYNLKHWFGLAPFGQLMNEITSWTPNLPPEPG